MGSSMLGGSLGQMTCPHSPPGGLVQPFIPDGHADATRKCLINRFNSVCDDEYDFLIVLNLV